MKPGGCSWFWPPHRFKDNARKKGNSLYLAFSEAQEESFLSKSQGLTKGTHPIKRNTRREHSIRTGSAAGEQLKLVARTSSHPRGHGAGEGPTQGPTSKITRAASFPAPPCSLAAQGSETSFCKIAINSWGQRA